MSRLLRRDYNTGDLVCFTQFSVVSQYSPTIDASSDAVGVGGRRRDREVVPATPLTRNREDDSI